MNLKITQAVIPMLTMICLLACPEAALSKKWTVEERQAKLMQDVNAGQKSGALSAKKARELRKELSNVARKKAKMKKKDRGALSEDDAKKLQESIDKSSTKIKQEQTEEKEKLEQSGQKTKPGTSEKKAKPKS